MGVPEPTPTDRTISRTLEALMAYRGLRAPDVCRAVHLSRSSYYNRVSGARAWSAHEVADLAQLLDVPVQTLFDGLPGIANITSEYVPAKLRLVVG